MPIIGMGIDIIEVNRVMNAVKRSDRFLDKVFTDREREYFNLRKGNFCTVAGNFAAKEAVLKALGTGLRDMDWKDIEIERDSLGKPVVCLYENALKRSKELGIKTIHITISHCRDYAVAQAAAEGGDEFYVPVDMTVPKEVLDTSGITLITKDSISPFFPKRKSDTNKGTYGRACIIGGSSGMMGAPLMCTKAALVSGAGIIETGVPKSIQGQVAPLAVEAIVRGLDEEEGKLSIGSLDYIMEMIERSSAYAVGPGLSQSSNLLKILGRIAADSKVPGVIDADGLNLLAQNKDILCKAGSSVILTPHPGEMSRLLGISISSVQEDRIGCARGFAVKYGAVVVLKGTSTVVASPEGKVHVNTTGNPGMAKGGSGDVLTGMIVSLLAQGFEPFDAARCGVYIHGLAGDIASYYIGEYGMKATDIISYIPKAIMEVMDGCR